MRVNARCAAVVMGLWLALGAVFPLAAAHAESKPKTVNLSALLDMVKLNKGKVVVVNFFATWCPPCKEEIPGLINLSKTFPASKLAVIGVSVDQDPKLVLPFTRELKVNFPVFHAADDVPQAFAVRTIPHNVIYDTQGQMAANVTGFVTEEELTEFINILLEQKKK